MSNRNYRERKAYQLVATLILALVVQSLGMPMSSFSSYEELEGVNQIMVNRQPQVAPVPVPSSDVDFLVRRQVRKETEAATTPMQYAMFKGKPPAELTVTEGSKAVLECEVTGTPKPLITWMKNGSPIYQGNERNSLAENVLYGRLSLSRVKSRLFLDCLSAADNGATYTCVASTPYKEIYTHTKVLVEKKKPASVAFTAPGSSGTLETIENKEGDYYANQNSIELIKDSLRAETAACLSKKSFASPARIYFWTHTTLENIGTDGVINCRASGSPAPQLTWYGPEENALALGDGGLDAKYSLLGSGDLLIRNVTFEDMGKYRCVAQNHHGSDEVDKIFFYPTEPVEAQN